MGILGLNKKNVGNAITNGITSGITGNVMGLMSGIGSIFGSGKDKAQERALQNEMKLMNLQNSMNREAARQTQEYNKQMWDYTNYENQVKHMKAAGLNTSLMYGMSGGGGVSSNGANVASTARASGGAEIEALGLQTRMQKAQIANMNASTAKMNAEANSINEHQNPKTDSEIKVNESLQKLNNMKYWTEEATQNKLESERQLNWLKGQTETEEAANAHKKGQLLDNEIKYCEEVTQLNIAYRMQEILKEQQATETLKAEAYKLWQEPKYWEALTKNAPELRQAEINKLATENEYIPYEFIRKCVESGGKIITDLIEELSAFMGPKAAEKTAIKILKNIIKSKSK